MTGPGKASGGNTRPARSYGCLLPENAHVSPLCLSRPALPASLFLQLHFQLGNARFHLLELLAGAAQHVLLHVEFLAGHEIKP